VIKPVRGSVGFSPLLRAKLGSGSVDCESIGRYCQTEFQCSTEFCAPSSAARWIAVVGINIQNAHTGGLRSCNREDAEREMGYMGRPRARSRHVRHEVACSIIHVCATRSVASNTYMIAECGRSSYPRAGSHTDGDFGWQPPPQTTHQPNHGLGAGVVSGGKKFALTPSVAIFVNSTVGGCTHGNTCMWICPEGACAVGWARGRALRR
jgi:hypothetical protein